MKISGGRFLLTGGASLIGSHVAEQLLEAGAGEVALFDNYALGSPDIAAFLAQDKRVRVVRGDITRLHELLDALDGIDGVFALAGFLTLPLSQNPGLGLDVNVRGMFNIVEACRHRAVKKVVFSSSVATFGDPEADEVDETTPFRWHTAPPALALYASSKIIGENLLRLYKQRYGLDYIALRYSTVYGERQHHRGVNALHIIESYERIKAGERPVIAGDGSEAHDYVYVGDVARANVDDERGIGGELPDRDRRRQLGQRYRRDPSEADGIAAQAAPSRRAGEGADDNKSCAGFLAGKGEAAARLASGGWGRGRHPPPDRLGGREQPAVRPAAPD
jgi:UDP-glucose 4-epimerase